MEFQAHVVHKFAAHTNRNPPLMFHDEAYRVLHVPVFRRAASLHLRLFWMSLMLDVLERVLHQIPDRSVLRRVQSLDMLQNIQHLRQREQNQINQLITNTGFKLSSLQNIYIDNDEIQSTALIIQRGYTVLYGLIAIFTIPNFKCKCNIYTPL